MKTRYVPATEFKAKCLGLLDEVNATGESVTITKRGKPVATLEPVKTLNYKTTEGMLAGRFEVPDDLESLSFADEWEVVREYEAAAPASQKRRRKAS
jgi:prevent-host-death family protein